MMKSSPNKALRLTAIPLRSIAAGELSRSPDRRRSGEQGGAIVSKQRIVIGYFR
jgi:hypothetical protein